MYACTYHMHVQMHGLGVTVSRHYMVITELLTLAPPPHYSWHSPIPTGSCGPMKMGVSVPIMVPLSASI